MIEVLYEEYSGDATWTRFAEAIQSSPRELNPAAFPQPVGCMKETATVIRAIFGNHAWTWFNSPIPALKGETPVQVLARHQGGDRVLRTLLMRMDR